MSKGAWLAAVGWGLAVLEATEAGAFTLINDSESQRALKGWADPALVFDVNATGCEVLGVSRATIEEAIELAASVWSAATSSALRIERGDAVSTIPDDVSAATGVSRPLVFCDDDLGTTLKAKPSDPVVDTKNIPASTRLLKVDQEGRIAAAVIHLNAEAGKASNVKNIAATAGFLAKVIAHEMGHAAGLGHSVETSALMYFDVTRKTRQALSEDDVSGVTYLYPRGEPFSGGLLGCGTVAAVGGREGGGEGRSGSAAGALEFAALLMVCVMTLLVVRRRGTASL